MSNVARDPLAIMLPADAAFVRTVQPKTSQVVCVEMAKFGNGQLTLGTQDRAGLVRPTPTKQETPLVAQPAQLDLPHRQEPHNADVQLGCSGMVSAAASVKRERSALRVH